MSNQEDKLFKTTTSLSALAHPARLSVFRLLAHTGFIGLSATELRAQMNISTSTFAFHVRVLHQAGLIKEHKKGRAVRYTANIRAIRSLIAYLNDHCVVPE